MIPPDTEREAASGEKVAFNRGFEQYEVLQRFVNNRSPSIGLTWFCVLVGASYQRLSLKHEESGKTINPRRHSSKSGLHRLHDYSNYVRGINCFQTTE